MVYKLLEKLPKGVRNNNPLNIRVGNDWNGEIPDGLIAGGNFEQFINPMYGFRAAARIIKGAYAKRGITTVSQVVRTWAPNNENPTQNYLQFVLDKTGLTGNESAADNLVNVLPDYHPASASFSNLAGIGAV